MTRCVIRVLACLFSLALIAACDIAPSEAKPAQAVALQTAEAGRTFLYNFDHDAAGSLPANFSVALTGKGSAAQWEVKADATAPSQPNVLAQVSSDKTGYRFPLAILGRTAFRDLDMSVRFKPVAGSVDQAAGLVWRMLDADNYYVVRANALEDNVVLYKVERGKRTDLPLKGEGRTYGKKVEVPTGVWSTLRVSAQGRVFEVFLNGRKLYEVEDDTFQNAGRAGLWTKADSVTYFDDFRIIAR